MKKRCELYLRFRAHELPTAAELEAIIGEADPAALLITEISGAVAENSLASFISAAQGQNLAVLIEDDVSLAKKLDADGVHLRARSGAPSEARRLLGENKSVGASCVLSRHEAMVMAEEGADYIAFGEFGGPDTARGGAVADMIHWWDELFEAPCVAWVWSQDDEAQIESLVRAGADFLAIDAGPSGRIDRLARIRTMLAAPAAGAAS